MLVRLFPLAKLVTKVLRFGLWIARVTAHYFFRIKLIKKIRRNFNKRSLTLRLARLAATKRHWQWAQKLYLKTLSVKSRRALDPDLQNEVRVNMSVFDRLKNTKQYQQQIRSYSAQRRQHRPNIAIFTAIAGGYDQLRLLPAVLEPNLDYVVFTDTPINNPGIYQIRPLPYFHADKARQARFVKTHPHQLLPEYDIAIWIDANIMILDALTPMIEKFLKSKRAVAGIPHPYRSSIFEEARACIERGKEDPKLINMQVKHYRKIGYDCKDLVESGVMMFNLKDKRTPGFFTTWWAEIDQYTRRDQLSLNYALDKNHIKWHQLSKKPHDVRDHPRLGLVPHYLKLPAVTALEQKLHARAVRPESHVPFNKIKREVIRAEQARRIDVIYCVHNALDDVKACLASVVRHRQNKNLRLIIVDDGSDEATAAYLKKFSNQHKGWSQLIRNDVAGGYTKAANIGLRASTGELAILLNSDTIVTAGWTEKMSHAVFSTAGAGIVGPLSSAGGDQSIPDYKSQANQTAINPLPPGITADDMNSYCEKWSVANVYPRVPLIHGFCFGVTREVIDKVGLFSEKDFPNGYGEENDYCFRATDTGFGLVIATNTYIFHAKSKSYPDAKRIELMKRGIAKLTALYGRERIIRAGFTMQEQPTLIRIRAEARQLY